MNVLPATVSPLAKNTIEATTQTSNRKKAQPAPFFLTQMLASVILSSLADASTVTDSNARKMRSADPGRTSSYSRKTPGWGIGADH